MKRLQFESPRLMMRPFKASDYQGWKQGLMGGKAAAAKAGPTALQFRLFRQRFVRLAAADHAYVFGIFAKRSGTVVGTVDFQTYSRDDRDWANLGYTVYERQRRKGYATEAATAAIRFGIDTLGYHRIEAAILPDHHASIGVVEKSGMVREGIRKSFWKDDNGWMDHVVYVAIKTDPTDRDESAG